MAKQTEPFVVAFILVALLIIVYSVYDPITRTTTAIPLIDNNDPNNNQPAPREFQTSPLNRAGGYNRPLPTMLAGSHRPIPTGGQAPSGMPFQGHGIYPGAGVGGG